jgi:hypothetical protein
MVPAARRRFKQRDYLIGEIFLGDIFGFPTSVKCWRVDSAPGASPTKESAMILVIFGAGASHDSVALHPADGSKIEGWEWRPPVADKLFDDRPEFLNVAARYPRCLEIMTELQNRQEGKSVEQVLQEIQTDATTREKKQLGAIRWYLHVMLSKCEDRWFNDVAKRNTNYLALLNQIERRREKKETVCIVTFNYDTLLERALPSVGVNIPRVGDMGHYVRNESYRLFKVHGSINWAHEIDTPLEGMNWLEDENSVNAIIEKTPELAIGRRIVVTDQQPIRNSGGTALFPAIAIPVETKTDNYFECPDYHIELLESALPLTRKILIVGWRGMEAHFVKLLRERLKKDASIPTMIVSSNGESAAKIGNRLAAEIPIQFTATNAQGFTEFVIRRTVEDFLKG